MNSGCKDMFIFHFAKDLLGFFSKKMYLCTRNKLNCQLKSNKSMEISRILQLWYAQNKRDLPWRETRDPYRIWLSEIILQQTRVAQGYDYYLKFVSRYPTVADLAAASEDDVLKLWQGLGYYSRARNLHAAALQVMSAPYNGLFPSRYEELRKLKGIGPYTAAAIASFSSDEPVAVVDGNVYRVLSRLFDIETPIDSTQGQKEFLALATELLDPEHPGTHNQAIMEFGALQCTPLSPHCPDCPLAEKCLSLANRTIDKRPLKTGKVKVRERLLHYYLYKYKDTLWVRQRPGGDIWQGLWEFVITEGDEILHPEIPVAFTIRHQLTHQLLICDFRIIELPAPIKTLPPEYEPVSWQNWQKKAVSKLISEANKKFSALF